MVRTWDDMYRRYPMNRKDMDEKTEREFVKDCFDLYEKEGFSSVFWSPYSDIEEREGQRFEVVDRCTEEQTHISTLPMWNIKFEDGTIMGAYPEEVVPREMRNNGCKMKDVE